MAAGVSVSHGEIFMSCYCSGCGQTFAGITIFDKHRVNDPGHPEHPHYGRRCLTPDEIRALGSELVNGAWNTPMSDQQRVWIAKQRRKRA